MITKANKTITLSSDVSLDLMATDLFIWISKERQQRWTISYRYMYIYVSHT